MGTWSLDEASRQNFAILQDLIRQAKVTVIIGAGLSQAGGLVGWKGMYSHLASEAGAQRLTFDDEDDFDPAPVTDHLQEVREILEADERYLTVFGDLFDNTISSTPKGYELTGDIFARFVTTNFDNFLEALAHKHHANPAIQVFPEARYEARYVYLHGQAKGAQAASDLVVCSDDYARNYAPDGLVRRWLMSYLSETPCVFLGFSFSDPAIRRAIEEAKTERTRLQQFPGRHYAYYSKEPGWFAVLSARPFSTDLNMNDPSANSLLNVQGFLISWVYGPFGMLTSPT